MTGFIIAVALVNALLYHRPLYSFAVANLDLASSSGAMTLVTVIFLVVLATTLILALVSLLWQRLVRPLCMLAALCNAAALYFIDAYGVVLDRTMMGNVIGTDVAEASSLLHPKLLLYLLAFGALPCVLLWRVRVRPEPWLRRATFLLVALLIGAGWIYATAFSWPWIDKNSKALGGMTLPWSYVFGVSRVATDRLLADRRQTPLPAARFLSNEKTIVVLVIGEAARSQNFSLYGYARPTNPQLARDGVVALPHARSCATYTTASVLCMLSHGEEGWHFATAYEPLPSYLQRHGIDVIWRTNNFGEPPIKVQTYQRAEDIPGACSGDSCRHDEALLHGLEQRIRSSASNRIFVVLHQHGSHGPVYTTSYPSDFETFKPVCKSAELSRCTLEELVNAYDNTILYTDDLLHRTIGLLRQMQLPSVMLYVSDHGESLGEKGLYLHGAPYSIAPDVQKDIPFLVWMSDEFKQRAGVTDAGLARWTAVSQANVFHSVMGAFDMRSDVYDPALDLFAAGSH